MIINDMSTLSTRNASLENTNMENDDNRLYVKHYGHSIILTLEDTSMKNDYHLMSNNKDMIFYTGRYEHNEGRSGMIIYVEQ